MVAVPRIMQDGKTPAQWVDELAARGIEVSERTLRERARQIGAYRTLGNAIVLLPEQAQQLSEPRRSPLDCEPRDQDRKSVV